MDLEATEELNRFCEKVHFRNLYDQLEDLSYDFGNLKEVLENNMFNFILANTYEAIRGTYLEEKRKRLKHILHNVKQMDKAEESCIDYIFHFFHEEHAIIEKELSNIGISHVRTAAIAYRNALGKNSARYLRIERYSKFYLSPNGGFELIPYMKEIIGKSKIDLEKLRLSLYRLFDFIDKCSIDNLWKEKQNDNLKNQGRYLNSYFNFELYADPVIFTEFPNKKKKYLKALKSWILNEITKRKQVLQVQETPSEFKFLEEYANGLVIPLEDKVDSAHEQSAPANGEKNSIVNQAPHIFLNHQAYTLFTLWSEYFNSHSQISFIYRMMHEQENPPLILVKDTPFREWFNQHQDSIILELHTRTFLQTQNNDRKAAYQLCKHLIYNNS